jgi:hypothetical protein
MGWYEKSKHAIRFWLLRRLPTCKQTTEVISQQMERSLSVRERLLLKVHLWVCAWCQWYLEQLQVMRSTLRAGATDGSATVTATLSAEARERIKNKIAGTGS